MGRWGPRGVTYLTPDTPAAGSMRTRPTALGIILGLEDEISGEARSPDFWKAGTFDFPKSEDYEKQNRAGLVGSGSSGLGIERNA